MATREHQQIPSVYFAILENDDRWPIERGKITIMKSMLNKPMDLRRPVGC